MEGSFLLVSLSDSDIVVSPTNVELRKVLRSVKLIDEFRDEWKRVTVLDRHLVKLAVVLHRSQRAILFLDEEERGGERRLGGANSDRCQVLVEERVELFLFVSVQGDIPCNRGKPLRWG